MTLTSASRRLNPDRIQTARLRRGLSKTKAAQLLGITPRTLSTYEKSGAPVRKASGLADTFGFTTAFLDKAECPIITETDVIFRAGRKVSAATKGVAIAAGQLGFLLDQWISSRFNLPEPDLPNLCGHDPRLAAQLVRQSWGLGVHAPLPNLIQLCESKGIRVYGLPPVGDAVDAFSCWNDGVPFIFLARRRTPEGVRFDVAHELGHLILHSNSAMIPKSECEHQANEFASEFLFPQTAISEYLPHNAPLNKILAVKSSFQISAAAAIYAAHKVGQLSDWTYRKLYGELERRGFKFGEPGGMTSYERSRAFPLVFEMLQDRGISISDIADDLGFPSEDVHILTLQTKLHGINTKQQTTVTEGVQHKPKPKRNFTVVK